MHQQSGQRRTKPLCYFVINEGVGSGLLSHSRVHHFSGVAGKRSIIICIMASIISIRFSII